ncbi:helix-turn-helix domain-containing protein [Streptomyces ureilyticus]|uniref:Helix-turn-helix domain-containing protein n=1 Tax=Streptomyces ureilyticus TaxID=1775131 RepID=A0ABX0DKS1_9ACTN|nr:helix-turn-helix domain-containing protein [Streptomyces ureilyticus]NGO42477.1 helix-turn-helix domain-containing protein [Streptomyces ureilyticus]
MPSDGGTTGRPGQPGVSELADLLEELKRRSGRSYAALAHRTGLSRSTLHRYCQGTTVPGTFGAVERVARVSGASPAELDRLYRAWWRATAGDAGQQDARQETGQEDAGQRPAQPPESAETVESPGHGGGATQLPQHAHPTEAGRDDAGTGRRELGARLPLRLHNWLRPAALLLALVIASAGSAPLYEAGKGRDDAGGAVSAGTANTGGDGAGVGSGAATGSGGEQRPEGPEWSEAPRRPAPEFIGMTINSDTGHMPGFRTGSARLWNSETRWGTIETARGTYDWTTLERLVRAAERDRLPVLFTIAGTPWWAAPKGRKSGFADSTASPPDDLRDWDRFVEKLATRYRGRIESYELWDYPSHPLMFAGSLETLAEMVERASRIIRRVDSKARLACPSFGSLWTRKGRTLLREFARTGAYEHCHAAALKMPPRKGNGRPEEIIELARSVRNLLHDENVSDIELWNTGPDWDIDSTPPLDARQARDYAVRFYLAGLYASHYSMRRMYFYNWGSTHVPIVVQPVGGPPAPPGKRVGRLAAWLDGARISACGQGTAMDLPPGMYSCRFQRDGRGDRGSEPFTVRWSTRGRAEVALEKGAYRLRRMDGSTVRARPGERISIGEEPVLIEHRSG